MPEPNTHVPHHTQRENDTTYGGGAEGAAPIGTYVRASEASAPFMCMVFCVYGVNVDKSCVYGVNVGKLHGVNVGQAHENSGHVREILLST